MVEHRCGDCRFSTVDGCGSMECRFNAPTPTVSVYSFSYWPNVNSDDWCGQFSAKPASHSKGRSDD